MEIIRTIGWMKEYARGARAEGLVLGLVPTMGALHEGHTALVTRARRECSRVIASVFVNPKQFGPKEDFAKYPRDLNADAEKLAKAGVDALFAPEAADVYPDGFRTYVSVEGISERLEGRSRPGHFRGVATVVLKLFEIVQPHFAYFGRKDAQQVRIIRDMARDLNLDAEIVVCPIVREPDGLALSSRNAYLNAQERKAATVLHRALTAARNELAAGVRDTLQLQTTMRHIIGEEPLAVMDYAEIVSADTFEPVVRVARPCYAVLAVFIGKTRLIDNLYIEPADDEPEEFVFHL
ncbi:MAG: pantoate--beta-alanine ligase [Candidatus Acidiferrum sp.]